MTPKAGKRGKMRPLLFRRHLSSVSSFLAILLVLSSRFTTYRPIWSNCVFLRREKYLAFVWLLRFFRRFSCLFKAKLGSKKGLKMHSGGNLGVFKGSSFMADPCPLFKRPPTGIKFLLDFRVGGEASFFGLFRRVEKVIKVLTGQKSLL